MPKLLMLKGLPASGKSTYAKELVSKGYNRLNRDSLRLMLHDGKWSRERETDVYSLEMMMAEKFLASGQNVVIDDTNLNPKVAESWKSLAAKAGAEFETKHFDTDVEECIRRDLKRGEAAVGEQVIRKMWRQYVAPVQPKFRGFGNSPAVIFDIDGTLAQMVDRGPYDYSEKVKTDAVVHPVADLLKMFKAQGYKILIFSGRKDECREFTMEWLRDNGIEFDQFRMRAADDSRKDYHVKKDFYDELKDWCDIRYAVDDRLQVCRLWHELGLCLLKVGDPDLEF